MGLLQRFFADPIPPGAHPVDVLVAWLTCRSKLFTQGWGDELFLGNLSQHSDFASPPAAIHIDWNINESRNGNVQRDGIFVSPFNLLPKEAQTVHIRARSKPGNDSACVILAGSREEGYKMREWIFGALPDAGINLYLPENPFYGLRRTTSSASLTKFSDHILMNLGMIWEAWALLEYLRDKYKKLAVAGYSMGGHMAAITAAICPFPVACAVLATGASAAPIYTQGLLSWSVDLGALSSEPQLQSAARERLYRLVEAADVTRHAPPVRPDAAVIVGGMRDGYILRSQIQRLHEYWPGSTLRWLPGGHVTNVITKRRALRNAIVDATERL